MGDTWFEVNMWIGEVSLKARIHISSVDRPSPVVMHLKIGKEFTSQGARGHL